MTGHGLERRAALQPLPASPTKPDAPGTWLAEVDGVPARIDVVLRSFLVGHRLVPHDLIPDVGLVPAASTDVHGWRLAVEVIPGDFVQLDDFERGRQVRWRAKA